MSMHATPTRSPEPLDTKRRWPGHLHLSHSRSWSLSSMMDGSGSPRLVSFAQLSLRRRPASMVMMLVSLCCILGFSGGLLLLRSRPSVIWVRPEPLTLNQSTATVEPIRPDALPDWLNPETYLSGPPTPHFRGSLRNDTEYLTSWLSAGWTNDVMTIGNLIYLALITSRVPILPPFTSHIGGSAVPIPFSHIFDVEYLARAINWPILEWYQIKDVGASEALGEQGRDEIGCWNIWEVDNIDSDGPRPSYTVRHLNLDISYTRAPASVKLIPGYEHDSHSAFWALAPLAFHESRASILADPVQHPTRPSDTHGVLLPPDEQLLCYDYLYYTCANEVFEYDKDYSPAWRFVSQHFHWTKDLEKLASKYLRNTLGLPEGAEIPPYITIHARRGDFGNWCGDVPLDECFAPLSAFARRVQDIKDELLTRGIDVQHVIMTGDEKDGRWWDDVKQMGWLRMEYESEESLGKYGKWYPVIIDAVVQSGSIGFVGTDRSTFSILARRRVLDWNYGIVKTVMWGHLDADAH